MIEDLPDFDELETTLEEETDPAVGTFPTDDGLTPEDRQEIAERSRVVVNVGLRDQLGLS